MLRNWELTKIWRGRPKLASFLGLYPKLWRTPPKQRVFWSKAYALIGCGRRVVSLILYTCLVKRSSQVGIFLAQESIVIFKFVDFVLQIFGLLLSTDTKLLNNLEDAPESHNHDQRCRFLNDTMQKHIDNKAGHND